MERRDFIIKSSLAAAAAMVAPKLAFAKTEEEMYAMDPQDVGGDFKVTSDSVAGGIRTVVAVPSAKVCSKQIDIKIDVKTKKIVECAFTRGCPGNAIGLCSLIKGMTVAEVIKRLKGTPCAARGTSCPDQLARVLESLHV